MFKILGGKRKFADRFRLNRLPGGGGGSFDRLHQGLDFDLLQHLQRNEFGCHARGFGDADSHVGNLCFPKTSIGDLYCVRRDWEKRGIERPGGVGLGDARDRSGILINDANVGVGNYGATLILHRARDRTGSAALRKGLPKQANDNDRQPALVAEKLRHTLLPNLTRPFRTVLHCSEQKQDEGTTTACRASKYACAAKSGHWAPQIDRRPHKTVLPPLAPGLIGSRVNIDWSGSAPQVTRNSSPLSRMSSSGGTRKVLIAALRLPVTVPCKRHHLQGLSVR